MITDNGYMSRASTSRNQLIHTCAEREVKASKGFYLSKVSEMKLEEQECANGSGQSAHKTNLGNLHEPDWSVHSCSLLLSSDPNASMAFGYEIMVFPPDNSPDITP